jgi:hypothetical protein
MSRKNTWGQLDPESRTAHRACALFQRKPAGEAEGENKRAETWVRTQMVGTNCALQNRAFSYKTREEYIRRSFMGGSAHATNSEHR